MIDLTAYAEVTARVKRVFPSAKLYLHLANPRTPRPIYHDVYEFELEVGNARCIMRLPPECAKPELIGRELVAKMAAYLYNN